MLKWQSRLDGLQQQLARELERLGDVALSEPCKTLRKITVHRAGSTLRVLVGVEIPLDLRTYFVSILRFQDPTNQKLTYVKSQTFRGISAVVHDFHFIVEGVRLSLERAVAKAAYPPATGLDAVVDSDDSDEFNDSDGSESDEEESASDSDSES